MQDDFDSSVRRKADELLATEGPIPENALPTAPEGEGLEPMAPAGGQFEAGSAEAVIRWHRPVLWVKGDTVNEEFDVVDPNAGASKDLTDELKKRKSILEPVLRSVGRIELRNNAQYEWAGTGWIVDTELGDDIIVTNAHVATLFAQRSQAGFTFRPGNINFGFPQSAQIDFRETIDHAAPREFAVTEIIWVSDDPVLDVAFLRVARTSGADRLSAPVRLATRTDPGRMVAIIGYPGDDSRSYDAEKFQRLFGTTFGVKRLAPGRLTGAGQWGLTHDCSTLPGNSGSVLLDLEDGAALGLHFSGTAFTNNFAVPGDRIRSTMRERPWQPALKPALVPTPVPQAASGGAAPPPGTATPTVAADPAGGFAITLPLEVIVRLGGGAAATTAVGSGPTQQAGGGVSSPETVAARLSAQLANDPAVLAVEPGFLFRDGVLSDDRGVIVKVAPGESLTPEAHGLAALVEGVEVVLEVADPETIVAEMAGIVREAVGARRASYQRDLSRPGFSLDPVTDRIKVTLHVSPEAGWPVLRDFLERTDCDTLTIGMYHMTAPHVVGAVEAAVGRGSALTLTLDRQRGDLADDPDDTGGETKQHDIPERDTLKKLETISPNDFRWTAAAIGGGLFSTAYHIKVAVWSDSAGGSLRDKAFWLSSGNWQSSNQPKLDIAVADIGDQRTSDVANYNREWHAVVEHDGLAATFRRHLELDYEDSKSFLARETVGSLVPDILVPLEMLERARRPAAQVFAPEVIDEDMTVQPLLTPDNYPEVVAALIAGARERVLIQNQSFSLRAKIEDMPPHFLKIAEAVRQKQRDGLDVRIIFRDGFGAERETLRRLKAFGIKTDADHIRYFDTCHTKGIVVDDDKVVLGSQNWTGDGTGPNRDASLFITNKRANAYFARLFEHDWVRVAKNRVEPATEGGRPIRFSRGGSESLVPAGYARVSLADFLGDG